MLNMPETMYFETVLRIGTASRPVIKNQPHYQPNNV